MLMHPTRAHAIRQTEWLADKGMRHEIFKKMMLTDYKSDLRLGSQLAFYRSQIPAPMAKIFCATGVTEHEATKRALDSGIVIFEILWHGFDHPRSRQMLDLMASLHVGVQGKHPEWWCFVLDTLTVVPLRFVEDWGWRQPAASERDASWWWWSELGARMGVEPAGSWHAAAERLAAFEAEYMLPTPEAARLTQWSLEGLRGLLPGVAQGRAEDLMAVLVKDERVRETMGLPKPGGRVEQAIVAALRARAVKERLSPLPVQPSWWPGRPMYLLDQYKSGYALDEVGPTVRRYRSS